MESSSIRKHQPYKIPEALIISRILNGEKELYELLIRRYNQKLFRVLRSYFNETNTIEDVMQNTYLKAYENLAKFRHKSSFSTWLIRIGINEALATLKVKAKQFDLQPMGSKNNLTALLEIPDEHQMNPEKKIFFREATQLLENAIDALEPNYKRVYILREVEEMSIREIAACLDLSEANVKVRIHRAKHMLKENLFSALRPNEIFEFGFSKCDRITESVMQLIT